MILTFVAVSLLIIGLGAFSAFRGLRPGRIGDEARCRRCDYELQGIDSPKCPECGTPLTPANVVRGKRYRRPWLAVAGLLAWMIGLGAGGTFAWVQLPEIDWIQYRPTSWLIDDLSSAVPTMQSNAWSELERRIAADSVSASRLSQLVDLTLQQQTAARPWPVFGKMANVVMRETIAGRLSDKQKRAFLSNLVQIKFLVRPLAGTILPYEVEHEGRGPDDTLIGYSEKTTAIFIDGHVLQGYEQGEVRGGFSGSNGGSSGSGVDLSILHLMPGPHTLNITQVLRLFTPYTGDSRDDAQPALIALVKHLSAPFSLLPKGVDEPIALVHDASIGNALQKAIRIKRAAFDGDRISFEVHVQQCPTDVVFDVYVVVNGHESRIGSAAFHSGGDGSYLINGKYVDAVNAKQNVLDVVLRSSPEAARKTVDFAKIWDGTLTIHDVPFTRDQP